MEKFKLDKVFSTGTLFRAETDKAYVIRKIGTDVSDTVTLRVAGVPCADIRQELASISVTSSNVSGLFDLKEDFVVIPNTKTFDFVSETSGRVRVVGEVIELLPGESLTTDLLSRFSSQGKKFITFTYNTLNIGTSWASGQDFTLINLTAQVKETLRISHRLGFDVDNLPAANNVPGQIAVRFFLNDKPLDIVESSMGKLGIDFWGMRLPPTLTNNFEVGSLNDFPIHLTEGMNLKVKLVNVGASITSGTAMVLKGLMFYEKVVQ
jgi:hypothetical protein